MTQEVKEYELSIQKVIDCITVDANEKCNPYCVCGYLDGKKREVVGKTAVVENNLNPEFPPNVFKFNVDYTKKIYIDIYDDDLIMNYRFAGVKFDIAQFDLTSKQPYEFDCNKKGAYKLSKANPRIFFTINPIIEKVKSIKRHFSMSKFSLNSKYFTNISLIAGMSNAYRDRKFSIIVNNSFKIEIPEVVAASVSTSVTQLLQTDPTATELHIEIESKRDISQAMDKIRRVIVSRETVSINDDEISIFGEFGFCIGNDDFMKPLNKKLNKCSDSLSCENVLDVLISKVKFGNSNIAKETNFIANNFESMRKLDSFIHYASNVNNIDIVESILISNELKLEKEDSLLTFLISVCRDGNNNTALFSLFEHVYVEYCSSECCSIFMNYVNEVVSEPGIRSLISCIGRRFVQSTLPLSPSFIEGRHNKLVNVLCEEISNEDPLKGILLREYKKGNALMEASSVFNNHGTDNLFDENKETYFFSNNIENSYIKASLKDGKTFVLNSYTLRGRNCEKNYQIQDWKLEGERSSDGKWILLDQHKSEPFDRYQIRTFNISCNERFKSVKITHTGKQPCGENYFTIAAFDIFGKLFN